VVVPPTIPPQPTEVVADWVQVGLHRWLMRWLGTATVIGMEAWPVNWLDLTLAGQFACTLEDGVVAGVPGALSPSLVTWLVHGPAQSLWSSIRPIPPSVWT